MCGGAGIGLPLSDFQCSRFVAVVFRHGVFLSKEPPAVDAWNSPAFPERINAASGNSDPSNRCRFSGCAALDDAANYCRQYDEVKERRHWYQEKPNGVHISTSSSIFGRPALSVKNF
jgi:hypothetical protein